MTLLLQEMPTEYRSTNGELFKFTVERYHEMIEHGLFTPEDNIELLDGQIVNKMGKDRAHSRSTIFVTDAFNEVVPTGFHVMGQEPITLSDSEPEPDVTIVRGHARDYDAHPRPEDVALLVEVSRATLKRDQGLKKYLYALAKIPVYWIVNLIDEQIEIYEIAGASDYLTKQTYRHCDQIPVKIDDQVIATLNVSDLLP